jgi:beta-lactamase class A
MKVIFLFFAMFFTACGPAMDANNFVRNANSASNSNITPTPEPDLALIKQIEEIAKESKGKVGVSAVLIETGETVGINQNEHFAMQSVVKLPISMAVLANEKIMREQKIKILKDELVPSYMRSPIRDDNPNGGEMTVEELIRFAISESDGTAADVLQRVAGDAKGVQAYIDSIGIKDLQVKYTHKEFGSDRKLQYENRATPASAVELLKLLWKQNECKAGADCTELMLLRFMTESNNPAGRIKGMLPPGTVVAHKTGTSGSEDGITSATNDIGIITLPNRNHIAIAVFVGDSSGDQKTREGAIAKITRAIFDKWNK